MDSIYYLATNGKLTRSLWAASFTLLKLSSIYLLRGYRPTNLAEHLDWYHHGIPPAVPPFAPQSAPQSAQERRPAQPAPVKCLEEKPCSEAQLVEMPATQKANRKRI